MLRSLRSSVALPTLLLVAGLVGCGSDSLPSPAQRLPGKWHGEMIVYEEEVAGKLPPEKIEKLARMQWDFEFNSDGSMVLAAMNDEGRAERSDGRWEIVKQDGDLLTIKSTEQTGKQKNINCEFDGTDIWYMPVKTEVAELGAMRFTRMR
jgi:hypothetical protein